MALPAQTLALLAMATVATATIQVNMDMAQHSFDDQYLHCSAKMTKNLPKLQRLDFLNNEKFAKNWTKATAEWRKRGSISYPLTPDQAIALLAYTTNFTKLYKPFNTAVRTAGYSSDKYRHEFHFKSLHFLLTQALQKLKPDKCQNVYRGVSGVKFNTNLGMKVRFGQFASTSLSENVAQGYGQGTMFKVRTCHGADIQEFSYYPEEEEVLIPPFETFRVIDVSEKGNTTYIELKSIGTFSNYNCEWLKGGSLPRNSPHLKGLFLATVAMAVVTGTL